MKSTLLDINVIEHFFTATFKKFKYNLFNLPMLVPGVQHSDLVLIYIPIYNDHHNKPSHHLSSYKVIAVSLTL